jgi:hypothetical protein
MQSTIGDSVCNTPVDLCNPDDLSEFINEFIDTVSYEAIDASFEQRKPKLDRTKMKYTTEKKAAFFSKTTESPPTMPFHSYWGGEDPDWYDNTKRFTDFTEQQVNQFLTFTEFTMEKYTYLDTSMKPVPQERIDLYRKGKLPIHIDDPVSFSVNPQGDVSKCMTADENLARKFIPLVQTMPKRIEKVLSQVNLSLSSISYTKEVSEIYEYIEDLCLSVDPLPGVPVDQTQITSSQNDLEFNMYKTLLPPLVKQSKEIVVINNGYSTSHSKMKAACNYSRPKVLKHYGKFDGSDNLMSRLDTKKSGDEEYIYSEELTENSVVFAPWPKILEREWVKDECYLMFQDSPSLCNRFTGKIFDNFEQASGALSTVDQSSLSHSTGYAEYYVPAHLPDGTPLGYDWIWRAVYIGHRIFPDPTLHSLESQAAELGLIMFPLPLESFFQETQLISDAARHFKVFTLVKKEVVTQPEIRAPDTMLKDFSLPMNKCYFTQPLSNVQIISSDILEGLISRPVHYSGDFYVTNLACDKNPDWRIIDVYKPEATFSSRMYICRKVHRVLPFYSEPPGNNCVVVSSGDFFAPKIYTGGGESNQFSLPGMIVKGKTYVPLSSGEKTSFDRVFQTNLAYNSMLGCMVKTEKRTEAIILNVPPNLTVSSYIGELMGLSVHRDPRGGGNVIVGRKLLIPLSYSSLIIQPDRLICVFAKLFPNVRSDGTIPKPKPAIDHDARDNSPLDLQLYEMTSVEHSSKFDHLEELCSSTEIFCF